MTRQVLTLELESTDVDSLAGRLRDQDGHAADFVGWLGLAAAIECLTAAKTADQGRGAALG
jgi:hypothetical protein